REDAGGRSEKLRSAQCVRNGALPRRAVRRRRQTVGRGGSRIQGGQDAPRHDRLHPTVPGNDRAPARQRSGSEAASGKGGERDRPASAGQSRRCERSPLEPASDVATPSPGSGGSSEERIRQQTRIAETEDEQG